MESKSPPLLPPPSTAPSQPEPGGLKIAPEAQPPAALVTFWVAQAEGGQAAGRQAAGPPGLLSQGTSPRGPRGRPVPASTPSPARRGHAESPGHARRGRGHEGTPQPRGAPEEGQGGGRRRGCGGRGAHLPAAPEERGGVCGLRRAPAGGGERDAPAQPQLVPGWAAPARAPRAQLPVAAELRGAGRRRVQLRGPERAGPGLL